MSTWNKRKLYLHIGHPKTGTSSLQTYFASNHELLKKNNLIYPLLHGAEEAARGNVTAGNGISFFQEGSLDNLDKNFDYLFSSEILFQQIDEEKINSLSLKDHELVIICCTRDIFSMYASSWKQYIQRSSGTLDFNDYLSVFKSPYKIIYNLKKSCQQKNIKLHLLNYDKISNELQASFLEILFPEHWESIYKKSQKVKKIVNRSFTDFETALSLFLNQQYGNSVFAGEKIVNLTPEATPEKLQYTKELAENLFNLNKKYMQEINKILPPLYKFEETLDRYPLNYTDSLDLLERSYVINGHVISALVSAITIKLKKTEESKNIPAGSFIRQTKEIEEAYKHVLDKADRLKLIKIAMELDVNNDYFTKDYYRDLQQQVMLGEKKIT